MANVINSKPKVFLINVMALPRAKFEIVARYFLVLKKKPSINPRFLSQNNGRA